VTLKARVMMLKILLCLTDLITFEKNNFYIVIIFHTTTVYLLY